MGVYLSKNEGFTETVREKGIANSLELTEKTISRKGYT